MREQTDSSITENGRYSGTRTALASLCAIASVFAASSCCLPILSFLLAAGFAGSSALLSAPRPYLLGASILFIAYGFYQAWQAKKLSGPDQCGRLGAAVGSCDVHRYLNLLSACDGERVG